MIDQESIFRAAMSSAHFFDFFFQFNIGKNDAEFMRIGVLNHELVVSFAAT